MSIRTSPWPAGVPCWMDLMTPDLPAAQEFYGEAFGWTFEQLGADYGNYVLCKRDGHVVAGMMAQIPGLDPGWLLYVATDDADATVTAVDANGGKVLTGPHEVPGRGRFLVAVDPAGARFGAWQHDGFIGAELINEAGGLEWNEFFTPNVDAARTFYAAVFGWSFEPLPDAGPTYALINGTDPWPLGGSGEAPDGEPPAWLLYLGTEDTDRVVTLTEGSGGRVIRPASDSPYGRMAVLAGADGAVFAAMRQAENQPQPERTG